MRTHITSLANTRALSLISLNGLIAQDTELTADAQELTYEVETENPSAEADNYASDTYTLTQSISQQILDDENLKKEISQSYTTGEMSIGIELDDMGQVSAAVVRQGVSERVDQIALDLVSRLQLEKKPYQGAKTLILPIHFRLY